MVPIDPPNANALAEHKPPKGVYGHELQSPWPKLERWKDPGARGNPNTPDMLGNFIQEIINRCNITDENEIKKPQTLHYKIPEGILKENVIAPEIQLPYSIPNLPVVLPNGTTRPYEFPNPGGISVWTFDDGRVLRANPIGVCSTFYCTVFYVAAVVVARRDNHL